MLKSALVFLSLLIAFFLADHFGPLAFLHNWKYFILVFFGAMSYLFHMLMDSSSGSRKDSFIQFYLTSVVIRLLACLIFVTIGLYLKVEDSSLFIINFFALYLFFTLFEIVGLYRKLQRF
jgi:hypothetical protein